MQVKYSPVRSDDKIIYTFEGENIHVVMGDVEDSFDFSQLTDGEMGPSVSPEGVSSVETSLPFNPIMSARRESGELFVELINHIGPKATYEERFPTWFTPGLEETAPESEVE